MKEIYIIKTKNDINGNPKYMIDTSLFPELKGIGRKRKNKPYIETFTSYNIKETIKNYTKKDYKILITQI